MAWGERVLGVEGVEDSHKSGEYSLRIGVFK